MTQISFPLSQAHEALDEFLAAQQAGKGSTDRMARTILSEDGEEAIAEIVPSADYDEMRRGYDQWLESKEQQMVDADLPSGYRPWRHSPLATVDRLLPTEPLMRPLAAAVFKRKLEDLTEKERDSLIGDAIWCLLRVTLDPDGQGAVPILALGHDPHEPGNALRWQLAFVTEVPGLFIRVTSNGFFGEEYGIVTGSGYILKSGWYDRDEAGKAVAALGRTLPNADWMRLTPDGFTDRAKEAMRAVLSKYVSFGVREDQPEPEVLADELPSAEQEVPEPAP